MENLKVLEFAGMQMEENMKEISKMEKYMVKE